MMTQLDRVINRYSIYKATEFLLFPFLTGFLFDLPLLSKFVISLLLTTATFVAQDFAEAIVKLWQAMAIVGLLFLLANLGLGASTSQLWTAIPILIVWFLLLVFGWNQSREAVGIFDNISIVPFLLIFVYLYRLAPRGLYENLAFIYHVDNTKSLGSIRQIIQTNEISLSLLSSTDSIGLTYFVKFVANAVSVMGKPFERSNALQAINAMSNSWMLLTLSYFFIGIRFVQWLIEALKIRSRLLVQTFSLLSMLWGLKISHSVGYFPLMLLNTIVIILLFSFRNFAPQSIFQKAIYLIVGLSLSCAMFGSWQPWLPVAGLSILVISYKIVGRSLLRRTLLQPKIFYPMLLLAVSFGWNYLVPKLSQIDLESPGRDHFPTETLLVFSGITLVSIFSLFGLKRFVDKYVYTDIDVVFHQKSLVFLSLLVSIATLIWSFGPNQEETLWFLLAVGLIFNRYSIGCIKKAVKPLIATESYDGCILFCFLSFGFVLTIFALSRFIGPVYEPMYAADKSAVAFYSQFFWFPLVVVGSLDLFGRTFFSYLHVALSLTVVSLGLQIPFAAIYDPVQSKWWHRPIINSLMINPNKPIVCSNSSEFVAEKETWVCTYFMDVLTDDEFTQMLAFQQIQLVGPRPVDLSRSKEILNVRSSPEGLVVFSCAPLDVGMTEFFSGDMNKKIDVHIQPSCDA